jgi:hypothetical protein
LSIQEHQALYSVYLLPSKCLLTTFQERPIVRLETGTEARIDLEKEDFKRRRKSIKKVHKMGRLPAFLTDWLQT